MNVRSIIFAGVTLTLIIIFMNFVCAYSGIQKSDVSVANNQSSVEQCEKTTTTNVVTTTENQIIVNTTEKITTTTMETTNITTMNTERITATATTKLQATTEQKSTIVNTITISFLGDCTLASNKNSNYANNMEYYLNNYASTYFFEKCMPIIGKDDFTIANCENVFTPSTTKSIYKNYSPAFWFRTDPIHAEVFANNSIDAVSIANNHTNDYGEVGFENTKQALQNVNVMYGTETQPFTLEKDGIKIGIICAKFWSEWYVDSIVSQIEELSTTTDCQIVFFHGGTEKLHSPEKWKVQGCRKFVDAGADLVVGGHPHVLQQYEEYNGTSIIYSIGNFCYGGHRTPENRTIIYQQTFSFNSDKEIVKSDENIIPFYVFTGSTNNWQPAPIEDETQRQKVLNFVYKKSNSLF